MSTIDRVEAKVTTAEPALLVHAALWLLALVGEFFIGRTHLVNGAEWSALTSYLTPIITTAVLALSAWITRTLVSPAAVFADRVEAEVQLRLKRAEQAAQGYLSGTAVAKPSPSPVVADPAPVPDPAPVVADPAPEPVAVPVAEPEPVPAAPVPDAAPVAPDAVADPT